MLRGQSLWPFIVSLSFQLITSSSITSPTLGHPGKDKKRMLRSHKEKSSSPGDLRNLFLELLITHGNPVNVQLL